MRFIACFSGVFLLAQSAFAGFLNASGEWRGIFVDENLQLPCDTKILIVQTEVRLEIAERTYSCDGGASQIVMPAIAAELVAHSDAILKVVVDGEVIGIVMEKQIQLNLNPANREALLIEPHESGDRLKFRESTIRSGQAHSLSGLLIKAI